MTTIGAGFIVLIVVWVIAALFCIIFSRAEGPLAFAGFGFILAAAIVTIALWFYPRGPLSTEQYVVYDYTYIPRTVLVSVCGGMLFIGLIVVAIFHVFEQHRGTPVKPWVY
jgi:cytochrome bd-type quinol oxidase subunit 2